MTDYEIYSLAFRVLKRAQKPMLPADICTAITDNGYCEMAIAPKPEELTKLITSDIASNSKTFFAHTSGQKITLSKFGSLYEVFCIPSYSDIANKSISKKDILFFKDRLDTLFKSINSQECSSFDDVVDIRIKPLLALLGYDMFNSNEVAQSYFNARQSRATFNISAGSICLISVGCYARGKIKNIIPKGVNPLSIIQTDGYTFKVYRERTNHKGYSLIQSFDFEAKNIDTFASLLFVLTKNHYCIDTYDFKFTEEDKLAMKAAIKKMISRPDTDLVDIVLSRAGIAATTKTISECKKLIKQLIVMEEK